MKTRKSPKKPAHSKRPTKWNEWLKLVESLDEMMAERASPDRPKSKDTVLDSETVAALNLAYSATLRYYKFVLDSGRRDEGVQRQISRLWQKAGTKMRRYDPVLGPQFRADSRFWKSEATWQNETIQKVWPHLNSIRTSANMMAPPPGSIYHKALFSDS